jgi:hypothetical protein
MDIKRAACYSATICLPIIALTCIWFVVTAFVVNYQMDCAAKQLMKESASWDKVSTPELTKPSHDTDFSLTPLPRSLVPQFRIDPVAPVRPSSWDPTSQSLPPGLSKPQVEPPALRHLGQG